MVLSGFGMGKLTAARHDLSELILPVIHEQLIGFIDDHVPHAAESQNVGIVHEMNKTARRSD